MFGASDMWNDAAADLTAQIQKNAEAERVAAQQHAPEVAGPRVFDPAAFTFGNHAYRIHFKNGNSGEYDGATLAQSFPFDVAQVESVEPVGD